MSALVRRCAKLTPLWLLPAIPVVGHTVEAAPTFRALSDIKPAITLINSYPANPADFPATFYSTVLGSSCTSTLIGTKVLLTAAHCVPNGARITIQQGTTSFGGTCTQAKQAANTPGPDLALCAMDQEPSNVIHETVNSNSTLLQLQMPLLLSGFGCVGQFGSIGNDGTYRIGIATVIQLPSPSDPDVYTTGGAAVCEGDSGGPAFVTSAAAVASLTPHVLEKRWMVGVNSKGDNEILKSALVSTSAPAAQAFFKDWAEASGLKICGVNTGAERCRELPAR